MSATQSPAVVHADHDTRPDLPPGSVGDRTSPITKPGPTAGAPYYTARDPHFEFTCAPCRYDGNHTRTDCLGVIAVPDSRYFDEGKYRCRCWCNRGAV